MKHSKSNFIADQSRVLPSGETLSLMWLSQNKIVVNLLDQYEETEIIYRERHNFGMDGELFEGFIFNDQFYYIEK